VAKARKDPKGSTGRSKGKGEEAPVRRRGAPAGGRATTAGTRPDRHAALPSRASAAGHTGGPSAVGAQLEAILAGVRGLKGMLQPLVVGPREPDAALEVAVDSLRRLLSELLERRLESVVQDLVEIRRDAATATEGNRVRALARIDRLLRDLGVLRFEAEPMDVVDPLIHTVIAGRCDDGVPDGLILEGAQPGFRSARGLVLSKAAVVVNRRA
jgi:hypothetical protein